MSGDVGAQLSGIAGSGNSEDQKHKYKALVDGLASASDVDGLRETLSHLLSDVVPQVVSRNVVAHFAASVARVGPARVPRPLHSRDRPARGRRALRIRGAARRNR